MSILCSCVAVCPNAASCAGVKLCRQPTLRVTTSEQSQASNIGSAVACTHCRGCSRRGSWRGAGDRKRVTCRRRECPNNHTTAITHTPKGAADVSTGRWDAVWAELAAWRARAFDTRVHGKSHGTCIRFYEFINFALPIRRNRCPSRSCRLHGVEAAYVCGQADTAWGFGEAGATC